MRRAGLLTVRREGKYVFYRLADEAVAAFEPWRGISVLALAAVLVIIGFWLPAPLLELIRGAARVVAGE
jgi:DNA-binding transcriptional ArsR family regulator